MSGIDTSLGPLELVDGRWGLGDRQGRTGAWLEFRADGLYQHKRNSEADPLPWSRIMTIDRMTLGGNPRRGNLALRGLLGGLPGPWQGHWRGYLHMTLRHPYEYAVASFDRHPRWYSGTEYILLEMLLAQAARTGETQCLGDPDRMGHVVERLAGQRPRTRGAFRSTVAEALQA